MQRGDSLAAIARSYGTSSGQLQAWNSGRYPSLANNPNVIEPGWELIVSGDPNVTPVPAPTEAPQPTQPPTGSGCSAGNRVRRVGPDISTTRMPAGVALTSTWARMDPAVDS